MKSRHHGVNRAPLMASTLLSVAFAVTATRGRTAPHNPRYTINNTAKNNVNTVHDRVSEDRQPTRWYQRIGQGIERQYDTFFHCALPSGLETDDFDLSD